ncbi:MAG: hypothetical protein AB7N91_13085 [Candidatus Tectimicrobiota bacterium]
MSPPPGLCGTCQFVKRTVTRRDSVFYMCLRAQTDATFRKYPPLPVLRCRGYVACEHPPAAEDTAPLLDC